MGDEPYMLEMNLRNVPVFVDTDRVRAAARAIREHQAEIVLLDDGFQQWRLKKDLEIVAIDATNPFGNRQVLPRGILREPLSALKRADIFVLTKANLNPDTRAIRNFLSRINPRALIIVSSHQPRGLYRIGKRNEILNPDALRQKTVALVSGIGDPGSFENLIKGLGINVGLHFSFPDHHRYSQQDLAGIITAAQKKKIDTIITTEKDAIRISRLQLKTYNLKLFVFSVALKISENEKELHRRLLRLHSA